VLTTNNEKKKRNDNLKRKKATWGNSRALYAFFVLPKMQK
jgi:hypothetical protein